MPRYFFNVIDGHALPDKEGTTLANPAEAKVQAMVTAGEMLRDQGNKHQDGREWLMRVTDRAGEPVVTIRISVEEHASQHPK